MRPFIVTGFLLAAVATAPAWAQHNARDAFWSASDLVSVSANPGANAAARPAAPAAPARRRPSPAAEARTPHVDPVLIAQNGYGEQPHMVRVSNDQIGLRYSILLRDSAGNYKEVSPTAVFHSGDYLHVSVMANQPGYLYVIQQGSSGSWSPIFPGKGSAPESNKIESGKVVEIPAGRNAFRFDSTPGQEKLFVIVSRRPLPDLDGTINGLKAPGGQTNTTAPAGRPDMKVYEAQNTIPDELMKRFASRDLSLVEVTDVEDSKKSDGSGEKAVYVVSKGTATSAGPQVVAALNLRHE